MRSRQTIVSPRRRKDKASGRIIFLLKVSGNIQINKVVLMSYYETCLCKKPGGEVRWLGWWEIYSLPWCFRILPKLSTSHHLHFSFITFFIGMYSEGGWWYLVPSWQWQASMGPSPRASVVLLLLWDRSPVHSVVIGRKCTSGQIQINTRSSTKVHKKYFLPTVLFINHVLLQ